MWYENSPFKVKWGENSIPFVGAMGEYASAEWTEAEKNKESPPSFIV